MRALVLAALAVTACIAAATLAGCGAVRHAISRSHATPTITATPRSTGTPTPTPTVTPTATPSATPTPPLPPNPDGLARWDRLPVTFCIAAGDDGYVSDAEFIATIERAFIAWGIPFRNDGLCGPLRSDDGVNEIGWGDLSARPAPARLYEAGLTQTVTSECTARCDPDDPVHLTEADITIDTQPPRPYRSARCLFSTMLHEVGHFLGLQHLPAPAIMAAETSGCPEQLTAADLAELRARYGAYAGSG